MYMKKTKFTGFLKWCIINRVTQEMHPDKLGLMDLLKADEQRVNEDD